jgi:YVTN family beta-propeller protein
MDEKSLRAQLELAVSAEPPLGPIVGNSVRAGRRLRRRRRASGVASLSAAAVVLVGVVPALTTGADHRASSSRPAATRHQASRSHPAATRHRASRSRPAAITHPAEAGTAYVATGSEVVPISPATNTAGPPIRVPEMVGDGPFVTNAATSPNGRTIYEVGWNGATGSTVTPIDTATNTAGPTITINRADEAQQFAVSPNGKTAYLSSTNGLFRISFATHAVSQLMGCSRCLYGAAMAFTPDGKSLYAITGNGRGTSVSVVRTASNTALASIALSAPEDKAPRQIAITPNGKTAYVLFSPAGAKPGDTSVVPISLATNTPLTPIKVWAPGFADNLVIAPDGRTAYVLSTHAVTAINTATNQAEATISLPEATGNAYYMELAPNGKTLYALAPNGVVPIKTATGAVLPTINVPHLYTYSLIAITPDSRTIYVGVAPERRTIYVGRAKKGKPRAHFTIEVPTSGGVVPISTATNTVGRFIYLGAEPDAINFAR